MGDGQRATFRNPLGRGADPAMVYHGAAYYLATTAGDRVRIWSAPSVTGLPGAEPVDAWVAPHPTDRSPLVWAPALWQLDGPNGRRWYIYFTWSETGVDADHRMYVLESAGDDPIGPYAFRGSNPASTRSPCASPEPRTPTRRAPWSASTAQMSGRDPAMSRITPTRLLPRDA